MSSLTATRNWTIWFGMAIITLAGKLALACTFTDYLYNLYLTAPLERKRID